MWNRLLLLVKYFVYVQSPVTAYSNIVNKYQACMELIPAHDYHTNILTHDMLIHTLVQQRGVGRGK